MINDYILEPKNGGPIYTSVKLITPPFPHNKFINLEAVPFLA
jgi:hypothetical protein